MIDLRLQLISTEDIGTNTIKDTVNELFEICKISIKNLTELIMVINHRSWELYEEGNRELSALYADLYYDYYEKAIDYIQKHYNEKDLLYFIRTLD